MNLPPSHTIPPAQAREQVRQRSAALPREAVASVRDQRVAVPGGKAWEEA